MKKINFQDGITKGNATTFNQLQDNIEEAINEIDEQVTGVVSYSTEEKVIGTWINGKPLYRKTIEFGKLPNATSKTAAHNVANISSVVKVYGYTSNNSSFLPLPFTNSEGAEYNISCHANAETVGVQTGRDRSSYVTTYITIEYVKSTD